MFRHSLVNQSLLSLNNTLSKTPSRSFSLSSIAKDYKFLRQEHKNNSLWVTLARPDVHNAFNEHVIAEITQVFQDVKSLQSKPRAVVLTGDGASFSAGADMNWMAKMATYSEEENKADARKLYDMVAAIRFCPVPTIARVNGAALGGGAGLVSACDIAMSVDTAVLGFTEVGIGLLPAVISPFVMEKIGKANCSRYFLTGERFKGPVAVKLGLCSESFATVEELDAAVSELLKAFSRNSPQAMTKAKLLIEQVSNMTIADSKEYVSGQIAAIRVSPEGQEGLKSFLEKRKPSFLAKM